MIDSVREILALNRGSDRVSLREQKEHLVRQGPASTDMGLMSGEDLRTEIVALSVFFIEQTWVHVRAFFQADVADVPDVFDVLPGLTPARDGFAPVTALDPDADRLTQIARHIEVFLAALGRFTEQRLAVQVFQSPAAPASRLFLRYTDLLARLDPPQTPTGHAIENGLAGLQVTLALIETVPVVYQRQYGVMLPRGLYEQIITAPDFQRLVLAIAATRSLASNALLAELAGAAFWTWRHSLSASVRLRFLPERFFLQGEPSSPPALHLRPEALAGVRCRMEQMQTPGRTLQVMCPAFVAQIGEEPIIRDFVSWIIAVSRRLL